MSRAGPRRRTPAVTGRPIIPRRHLSRHRREQRLRRLLYAGFAVLFAVIVAVPLFAYYREVLTKGSQPAVTVDGQAVTLDSLAKLYGYRRINLDSNIQQIQQLAAQSAGGPTGSSVFQQQLQRLQGERAGLDQTVLNELVEQRLVAAEGVRRGLTVSREEEDAQIGKDFGAAPPASDGTPVPTIDGLAWLRQVLDNVKFMNEDDFRALVVRPTLLSQKVRGAVAADVPTREPQVRARHILVDGEDAARSAKERLAKGEAFEQVASELSKDTANKDKGGDLGWFGRGRMAKPFEDAAFDLPLNQVSEPINTTFGWHLIELLERDDSRELEESQIQARRDERFRQWLDKQKDDAFARGGVEYDYSLDDVTWAKNQVNRALGQPLER